eukprot:CAMPEP_0181207216 /NCGR_PEP_ID=MMETSP1096-20121128/21463_1 /TAXON_ID=156174 ORGANISM="Chrysochromulina ericina, Strain CCMP281" /NCGR_SAMPLE_ID=MMETSP1096 /ASSEMBLY_ACC=CAM_ASM_000453 /LENGTH=117 /DNA_ID=CAMNT_0023298193 /DNA_START=82 /DNA_END=436 /DNA_ORIENTATION=+
MADRISTLSPPAAAWEAAARKMLDLTVAQIGRVRTTNGRVDQLVVCKELVVTIGNQVQVSIACSNQLRVRLLKCGTLSVIRTWFDPMVPVRRARSEHDGRRRVAMLAEVSYEGYCAL